jgi:hypothetical protein
MDTLLAVLLYFNVITPNSTYNMSQLCNYEHLHQPQIINLKNDEYLYPQVLSDFTPLTVSVIVINDDQCR